ncbi:cyclin-like protein [Xylona heveae TC161]|uniref:Cyclin-like protein n=1 Tax=Xylona heveae (strain CBS 132557 / TC161) TaxID=1328760 RepID=A0A164ZHC8_XYLHT|nr:cyclin-like protein [Xylona heveae TC161]KZF19105.1 cyclin-like protein [Xylona heveae TC161]
MTEDEAYRTSTQYRLWSFTPEALASLRSTTNALAADRVRIAIKRTREAKALSTDTGSGSTSETETAATAAAKQQNGRGESNGTATPSFNKEADQEIECLTVEEEQKLIGFYCVRAMELSDFCNFPTNVKATAVQFLKRFYLSNSPMTYHPKSIMPSAVFLATKTENHYTSLRSFSSKLGSKVTPDDVIAPEYLVTQGLRFTFDVRHPLRGLEGGFMELLALAEGKGVPLAGRGERRSPQELQAEMQRQVGAENAAGLTVRIRTAHGKAKEILKTAAVLTDAYFLYTPSQIWLATLLRVDEPLAMYYIDTKFPLAITASSGSGVQGGGGGDDGTSMTMNAVVAELKAKLVTTLRACATLLASTTATVSPSKEEFAELKRIDKKLYACRNPEKIDIAGLSRGPKREGASSEEEQAAKKRKFEREKADQEAADVFGPELKK